MSINFNTDKLESARYQPAGMPKAPLVAVFEKDGKKLVYIAETHGTVESFDLINKSFDFENSGLPQPDKMLIEFETSGRQPVLDLSDKVMRFRAGMYKAQLKQSPENRTEISKENRMNTLEYAGAVARSKGADVGLIDMTSDEMRSALKSEYKRDFSQQELDEILHATTGKMARPGAAATPHDMFMFLMKKRDEYMISKMADALNKDDTVWAILGEGHFRAEYPALVDTLGQPKYINFSDKGLWINKSKER